MSTATSTANGGDDGSFIIAFFLLVFVAIIGLSLFALTKHAETSHAGQTWNATTIKQYMDAGGCKPKIYICPRKIDKVIKHCEISPGMSIGLVVGKAIDDVITGFAASTSYWTNYQNRCY